nr:hypothetical protein [Capnocytophaga canimorsus]
MKINLWYWFFGVFLLVSCQNVQKTTKANYQVVPLPEKIEKKRGKSVFFEQRNRYYLPLQEIQF